MGECYTRLHSIASELLPLVPALLHLRGWMLLFFLTRQYQNLLRTGATSRIRRFNKPVGYFVTMDALSFTAHQSRNLSSKALAFGLSKMKAQLLV